VAWPVFEGFDGVSLLSTWRKGIVWVAIKLIELSLY